MALEGSIETTGLPFSQAELNGIPSVGFTGMSLHTWLVWGIACFWGAVSQDEKAASEQGASPQKTSVTLFPRGWLLSLAQPFLPDQPSHPVPQLFGSLNLTVNTKEVDGKESSLFASVPCPVLSPPLRLSHSEESVKARLCKHGPT